MIDVRHRHGAGKEHEQQHARLTIREATLCALEGYPVFGHPVRHFADAAENTADCEYRHADGYDQFDDGFDTHGNDQTLMFLSSGQMPRAKQNCKHHHNGAEDHCQNVFAKILVEEMYGVCHGVDL